MALDQVLKDKEKERKKKNLEYEKVYFEEEGVYI